MAEGANDEFKFQSPEEIDQLPIFPEPASEQTGEVEDTDRGSSSEPGYVYLMQEVNTNPRAPVKQQTFVK